MRRALPLVCALAALVSACGGGGTSNDAPAQQPVKSRLASFDAGGLETGLELPDFTDYWTLAEARNGNVYPVKSRLTDSALLVARIDAKGEFALREGQEFAARNRAGIISALDSLAEQSWNEEKQASPAALILYADVRAPFRTLLDLCRELVNLRLQNLWLLTQDGRDDSLRLLPLLIDTTQFGNEAYELAASAVPRTLRFTWVRNAEGDEAGLGPVAGTTDEPGPRAKMKEGWKSDFAAKAKAFSAGSSRVQFDLPQDATINEFCEFANLFAPIGYDEIEPYWPALTRFVGFTPEVQVRELAAYQDAMGVGANLSLPTLSHWWRASEAERGLAAAGEIDNRRPLLAIRANADGSLATRAKGAAEWATHPDDLGALQALRQNAGEVDFDTGLSELQILLAIDRNAKWETFLGVLEMMHSVGCFRLLLLTNDLVGPTLRLLQLDLPVGDPPLAADVAAVVVAREGTVAQGRYTVTMALDGAEHKTTGPGFSSSLTQWTGGRKKDPSRLAIKLPRDEPFETLFTILNSVAWLGVGSVSFGG